MSSKFSLRKSLHSLPAFRSLSHQEWMEISRHLVFKKYRSGEVLWRIKTPPDFLGIIREGEVVIEHRYLGGVIRSIKRVAGELILPQHQEKEIHGHLTINVQAVTDVQIYILPLKNSGSLHSRLTGAITDSSSKYSAFTKKTVHSHMAWILLVTLAIMLIIWQDLTRIASGGLYLAARGSLPSLVHDTSESLQVLDYAETIDREAAFAYNQEGYLWFQLGNLPRAEQAFEEGSSMEQTNAPVLNNQAVTLFTMGQYQQASRVQQDAARHDPNHSVVSYNLGLMLMDQGNYANAIRAFKLASFVEPDWTMPYIQEGFAYIKMQNLPLAEQAAWEAIKTDASQSSAYLILAIALHDQGKDADAKIMIEHAMRLDPENRVTRFYKALILGRLGEVEEAREIFQQLLDTSNDPQFISRIAVELEALDRVEQNMQVESASKGGDIDQ